MAGGDLSSHNAFTASWLMQTSFSPPQLALAINPSHSSYETLNKTRCCTINVIRHGDIGLVRHFAQSQWAGAGKLDRDDGGETKRALGKDELNEENEEDAQAHSKAIAWHAGANGCAILGDALAYMECVVQDIVRSGDHMIAILRLERGEYRSDASPKDAMLYEEAHNMGEGQCPQAHF